MTTYLITPVCRTIECADRRQAQAQAQALHPAGKATPVISTGIVCPDDYRPHLLDTYA